MPGNNDFVSVRQEGKRVHVQKSRIIRGKCTMSSRVSFQLRKLDSQSLLIYALSTVSLPELVAHILSVSARSIRM